MKINSNRKLLSNFISLSAVQAINFLVPLLITPYVIARVGIDRFGAIALAQTLMIYLSTITDYGFNISATKEIALYKDDKSAISHIFFKVLLSKLIITFFLFILLLLLVLSIPVMRHHFQLYVLGFTFVVAQAFFINWLFLGIQKMHFITIASLISRLIFVILVFAFIHNQQDDRLFLFFLGAGNMMAALLSIFLAVNLLKLKWSLPTMTGIIEEIKKGWQVTLALLSLNTYLLSGIFMLRFFTNDTTVGYYSIAARIFFAARQVLAVFAEAVYPQVCQVITKGKEAVRIFFKNIYLPFAITIILGSFFLFVFSPEVVYIFLKDKTGLPVLLLRLLSFVPVIVCLNIPAYELLLAFDRKKSYLRVFGLATVINIAANIFLASQWGAIGTVTGIMITELFISVGLTAELYKNKLSGFISRKSQN